MRRDNNLTFETLGQPSARGRTAEIYTLPGNEVLKLFNPGTARSTVLYEAEIAAKVHAAGQICPAVGEVVDVDGRYGLVYERFEGELLMTRLRTAPGQFVSLMQTMAQLHAEMHRNFAATLPPLRVRLRRRIEIAPALPDDLRRAALLVLAGLPDGDRLCHGDFHPENILLAPQRPLVIDWNDAAQGHPLADVARTVLLFRFAGLSTQQPQRWFDRLVRSLLLAVYLRHYRRTVGAHAPYDTGLLGRWLIPVAAARLAENVTEEEPYLLRYLAARCKRIENAD